MNPYIYDEICAINKVIRPSRRLVKKGLYEKEYVIFLNDCVLSHFFASSMLKAAKEVSSLFLKIVRSGNKGIFDEYLAEESVDLTKLNNVVIYDDVETFKNKFRNSICHSFYVCSFFDAEKELIMEEKEKILLEFNCFWNTVKSVPGAICLHDTVIPEIKVLPDGMYSLAEHEYFTYVENTIENSMERFVIDLERQFSTYVKNGLCACTIRTLGLFGPGTNNWALKDIISQLNGNNDIFLNSGMVRQYKGFTYIRYAVCAYFRILNKVVNNVGNVYHMQQYNSTLWKVMTSAYELLIDIGITLSFKEDNSSEEQHASLCSKKIGSLKIKATSFTLGIEQEIHRTIAAEKKLDYSNRVFNNSYDGKLELVKSLELEMITEIKRICDKYKIKYFLVGGSLLGAIRHAGFIPWDDDLDIGMLRDDYELFRRVAPQELNNKYFYQSYFTEDNSHYSFDKVRLKNTYFSTKFSNQFRIQNGIFIDILVYDKTADSLRGQKWHIRELQIWNRAINIRWVNHPRKNIAYRLSKALLPIMRLFPYKFWHSVFNHILTKFNKSNSKWGIDGVGQNIGKGAFPLSWFDQVIEVPFENMMLPIPKEYDAYLRHWYGDNYMKLLPYSERYSGHSMSRIDLGNEITKIGFDKKCTCDFSLKGELFEQF